MGYVLALLVGVILGGFSMTLMTGAKKADECAEYTLPTGRFNPLVKFPEYKPPPSKAEAVAKRKEEVVHALDILDIALQKLYRELNTEK